MNAFSVNGVCHPPTQRNPRLWKIEPDEDVLVHTTHSSSMIRLFPEAGDAEGQATTRAATESDRAFKLQQRRAMNTEIRRIQEQKWEEDAYECKHGEQDEAIVAHVLRKLYHFLQVIDESSYEICKHQEDLNQTCAAEIVGEARRSQ